MMRRFGRRSLTPRRRGSPPPKQNGNNRGPSPRRPRSPPRMRNRSPQRHGPPPAHGGRSPPHRYPPPGRGPSPPRRGPPPDMRRGPPFRGPPSPRKRPLSPKRGPAPPLMSQRVSPPRGPPRGYSPPRRGQSPPRRAEPFPPRRGPSPRGMRPLSPPRRPPSPRRGNSPPRRAPPRDLPPGRGWPSDYTQDPPRRSSQKRDSTYGAAAGARDIIDPWARPRQEPRPSAPHAPSRNPRPRSPTPPPPRKSSPARNPPMSDYRDRSPVRVSGSRDWRDEDRKRRPERSEQKEIYEVRVPERYDAPMKRRPNLSERFGIIEPMKPVKVESNISVDIRRKVYGEPNYNVTYAFSADHVSILRRKGEGLKPIFDREEIKRFKYDDENEELIETRVVKVVQKDEKHDDFDRLGNQSVSYQPKDEFGPRYSQNRRPSDARRESPPSGYNRQRTPPVQYRESKKKYSGYSEDRAPPTANYNAPPRDSFYDDQFKEPARRSEPQGRGDKHKVKDGHRRSSEQKHRSNSRDRSGKSPRGSDYQSPHGHRPTKSSKSPRAESRSFVGSEKLSTSGKRSGKKLLTSSIPKRRSPSGSPIKGKKIKPSDLRVNLNSRKRKEDALKKIADARKAKAKTFRPSRSSIRGRLGKPVITNKVDKVLEIEARIKKRQLEEKFGDSKPSWTRRPDSSPLRNPDGRFFEQSEPRYSRVRPSSPPWKQHDVRNGPPRPHLSSRGRGGFRGRARGARDFASLRGRGRGRSFAGIGRGGGFGRAGRTGHAGRWKHDKFKETDDIKPGGPK